MSAHARPPKLPFADLDLAQRLERAEAIANRRSIEARRAVDPDHGADCIEIGGTTALFDGVGSPLTQSFGLGMTEPLTRHDLDTLETFFFERGSDALHEVSPLADPSALALLGDRGYRPIEQTNVLYRLAGGGLARRGRRRPLAARPVAPDEEALWIDTMIEGWGEFPEVASFLRGLGTLFVRQEGCVTFLVEDTDGRPIASGALSIADDVALLAGASTIPPARRRGAQLALLRARLEHAVESGCELMMLCAAPGSASQRNAERQAFRIAYTRTKWQRSRPA
ncbi:MAG: GNAT family N-acetyltransferase [Acidobacteriota bacterium]